MKSHGHWAHHWSGATERAYITRISFSRMPKTMNTKTKNEPMDSNKILYFNWITLALCVECWYRVHVLFTFFFYEFVDYTTACVHEMMEGRLCKIFTIHELYYRSSRCSVGATLRITFFRCLCSNCGTRFSSVRLFAARLFQWLFQSSVTRQLTLSSEPINFRELIRKSTS